MRRFLRYVGLLVAACMLLSGCQIFESAKRGARLVLGITPAGQATFTPEASGAVTATPALTATPAVTTAPTPAPVPAAIANWDGRDWTYVPDDEGKMDVFFGALQRKELFRTPEQLLNEGYEFNEGTFGVQQVNDYTDFTLEVDGQMAYKWYVYQQDTGEPLIAIATIGLLTGKKGSELFELAAKTGQRQPDWTLYSSGYQLADSSWRDAGLDEMPAIDGRVIAHNISWEDQVTGDFFDLYLRTDPEVDTLRVVTFYRYTDYDKVWG